MPFQQPDKGSMIFSHRAVSGDYSGIPYDFVPAAGVEVVSRRNEGMKRQSRIVNPALFTIDGPYEMDPALQLPVLPALAPTAELAHLDPTSDEYRFLRTQLVRRRTRVHQALLEAAALAESLAEPHLHVAEERRKE